MDGIKISIRQSADLPQPAKGERGPRVTLQAVTLEPAQPADDVFLLEVYASTCSQEMAFAGWSREQRGLYLGMRYEAERHSRARAFPEAEYWIIRRDDVPAGSMIVSRSRGEVLLLDLALLPEHRNKKIGSLVMASLMEEASQSGKVVRLRVQSSNPARDWLHRVGFEVSGVEGGFLELVWRPRAD